MIVGGAIVVGDPVVRDTAEKPRPCPVTLNTVVISVPGFADLRYKFLREQKSHAQFLAVGTYDSRRSRVLDLDVMVGVCLEFV